MGMIWIQAAWHSTDITENFFLEKNNNKNMLLFFWFF